MPLRPNGLSCFRLRPSLHMPLNVLSLDDFSLQKRNLNLKQAHPVKAA
jgi:hypothetical protein